MKRVHNFVILASLLISCENRKNDSDESGFYVELDQFQEAIFAGESDTDHPLASIKVFGMGSDSFSWEMKTPNCSNDYVLQEFHRDDDAFSQLILTGHINYSETCEGEVVFTRADGLADTTNFKIETYFASNLESSFPKIKIDYFDEYQNVRSFENYFAVVTVGPLPSEEIAYNEFTGIQGDCRFVYKQIPTINMSTRVFVLAVSEPPLDMGICAGKFSITPDSSSPLVVDLSL